MTPVYMTTEEAMRHVLARCVEETGIVALWCTRTRRDALDMLIALDEAGKRWATPPTASTVSTVNYATSTITQSNGSATMVRAFDPDLGVHKVGGLETQLLVLPIHAGWSEYEQAYLMCRCRRRGEGLVEAVIVP